MNKARDLVYSSARLIGVLSPGEPLPASEGNDALEVLNAMLDAWSTQGLTILSNSIEEFALTSNQQSYTIGDGGDFDTIRPTEITNLNIKPDGESVEIPVQILNIDEWARLELKETGSTIPIKAFYNPTYPLGTLLFYPKPMAAAKAVIYSKKIVTKYASLNSDLSLAPGYERAMRYNLAVELAQEYGRPLSAKVEEIARTSLADIKRKNTKPVYARVDEAAQDRRSFKSFNYRTGDFE